ncbi:SusC/RagA family TonB-linked outer membrane protein [Maribellus maritimus]|uniref:SusC/RagA family TonB-linked outer membrane protein n=1 Tax=Maribellus maritimus TaxID=2870838 RepID=UPI001EE9ECC2|nr:SusC/RagA family TonB-linked outer membrane protein [Maribellus maritimus]MCG6190339.1 SusC/RagA family TonB-linked outer membrane protein [Maribellus maritimus]
MKKKLFFLGCQWSGMRKMLLMSGLSVFALFFSVIAIATNNYSVNTQFDSKEKNAPELNVLEDGIQSQKLISGKVTDSRNMPLPGVTVVVKGTTQGTTTNADGEYTITNVPENATLLFSFVGMTTNEVEVNGQGNIDVVMVETAIGLDEVVVTALGITRDKKSLGYSVGTVDGEELNETPQASVLSSLQGKTAGVQISQTYGVKGSSMNMVIRGATSLNSDNQPLFVVDGVPVYNSTGTLFNQADLGNAISDLNPDDIESISVLKGPSAAALYGSRAANGVVLITSKSGSGKKTGIGVDFNTSFIVDNPYSYLPVQNEFASGQEGAFVFENDAYEFWGPELNKGFIAQQRNQDSPSELISHENNINRQQDFYQNGWTQTNNVGINGNYDNANFHVSLGNYANKGIMPNIDLKKNNIGINGTMNLTDNLDVTVMTSLNESKSDNRPNTDNSFLTPTRAILTIGPQVDMAPYINPETWWMPNQEGVVQRRWKERWNNPYLMQELATTSFDRKQAMTKIQVSWEFVKGLKFSAKYLRSNFNQKAVNQRPWDTNNSPNGNFDIQYSNFREQNWEGLFSYNKTLTDFTLLANIGGNLRTNHQENIHNSTTNLVIPGLYTISNGGPGSVTYTNFWSEKKVNSVFGQASLGYKNMVYLDLTARNDWSSTLPKENRSYFYPSASLSLLVHEMIDMPEWVSQVKVRAGYAQVGNDVDPYQLQRYYEFGEDWGSTKRANLTKIAKNAQLKPEIATSKEIGADLAFFDHRISLDATYYTMDNKNQVLGISTPITSGAESKQINAGLVRSKGWDVTLNTSIIRQKDFSFDLGLNFTRNRTTIVELADGIEYFGYSKGYCYFYTYPGDQVGDIYQAPFFKVEDENSEYYGHAIIYSNGKPNRDNNPDHFEKIGNYNPDFILGISPSIDYKNFSLTAVFDWRSGGEFYSETLRQGKNDGRFPESINGSVDYDPNVDIAQQIRENPDKYINEWVGGRTAEYGGFAWTDPAKREERSYINADGQRIYIDDASFDVGVREDGNGGYIENFGGEGTIWLSPYNAQKGADRYLASANLYSATYVKLRELSLTYRFPRELVNKMRMQNMSLSLIGQNLFMWTKHSVWVDPETAFTAIDDVNQPGYEFYSVIPRTRSFGVKLIVGF